MSIYSSIGEKVKPHHTYKAKLSSSFLEGWHLKMMIGVEAQVYSYESQNLINIRWGPE